MIDLGINSDSIHYETALEILGQSKQPFMTAIINEKTKSAPSKEFIKFCEMRLAALSELQDELRHNDIDTIAKILDKNETLIR